ncbi:hypothetical protein EYC80_007690 [Monilinia laxa]|uniref:Uncharacterized protein n=1 Tax=Monilinia laxa TaxID=61186 RepID=A0A5N6JWP3_MONLA|nr:hypothetical protein EYC80_007690 [Monilinia laxa]
MFEWMDGGWTVEGVDTSTQRAIKISVICYAMLCYAMLWCSIEVVQGKARCVDWKTIDSAARVCYYHHLSEETGLFGNRNKLPFEYSCTAHTKHTTLYQIYQFGNLTRDKGKGKGKDTGKETDKEGKYISSSIRLLIQQPITTNLSSNTSTSLTKTLLCEKVQKYIISTIYIAGLRIYKAIEITRDYTRLLLRGRGLLHWGYFEGIVTSTHLGRGEEKGRGRRNASSILYIQRQKHTYLDTVQLHTSVRV